MARELIKRIKDISDTVITTNSIISEGTEQFNIVSKKGLLNVVQNFVPGSALITGSSLTNANRSSAPEITQLRTSITTSANNSKIMYDLILRGESNQDVVFYIQRVVGVTVTEIGSSDASSAGSRPYGFASQRYDNEFTNTSSSLIFKFFDSPNVPSGTLVQYRVRFYNYSGIAPHSFALNGTLGTTDGVTFERVSSTLILSEYGIWANKLSKLYLIIRLQHNNA